MAGVLVTDGKTQNDQQGQQVYLSGNPVCLVILNINSYSAGAMDMWQ